jgi:hypothetical protein
MPCAVTSDLNFYLDEVDRLDRLEALFEQYRRSVCPGKTLEEMSFSERVAYYVKHEGQEKVSAVCQAVELDMAGYSREDIEDTIADALNCAFGDYGIWSEESLRHDFEESDWGYNYEDDCDEDY